MSETLTGGAAPGSAPSWVVALGRDPAAFYRTAYGRGAHRAQPRARRALRRTEQGSGSSPGSMRGLPQTAFAAVAALCRLVRAAAAVAGRCVYNSSFRTEGLR
eukprot:TRINITY_DN31103_c0_g1_i1.p2 TRINITY_DN31103_c0_g1~~TRINITY_DN31103_c0_g1_i1.p2  ORF type:complete len:103 (+),score=14.78 TRINITY_DN31103_c0_g1_i1:3-311(+)